MGVSINAQRGDDEYTKHLCGVAEGFMERFINPWLWPDIIYSWTPSGRRYYHHLHYIHEVTRKVRTSTIYLLIHRLEIGRLT